jgi:hypothetical protein
VDFAGIVPPGFDLLDLQVVDLLLQPGYGLLERQGVAVLECGIIALRHAFAFLGRGRHRP